MPAMPSPPPPTPGAEADPLPLDEAASCVGDRWSMLVVWRLLVSGPQRFGDLHEGVAGIAPNILSTRLKRLERDQVVVARAYSRRPPRFVYELTESGQELAGALRMLAHWGARRSEAAATHAPRHAVCGTALEARWYCPTCEATLADDGAAAADGPDVTHV